MEKVIVVKEIPGMLKIGDVLVSNGKGGNFILREHFGNNERLVDIDYVTVSDNVPEFFEFVLELKEVKSKPKSTGLRSNAEIEDRLNFFKEQAKLSLPGSESEIVFTNLIWFIEWLRKEKNLLSW